MRHRRRLGRNKAHTSTLRGNKPVIEVSLCRGHQPPSDRGICGGRGSGVMSRPTLLATKRTPTRSVPSGSLQRRSSTRPPITTRSPRRNSASATATDPKATTSVNSGSRPFATTTPVVAKCPVRVGRRLGWRDNRPTTATNGTGAVTTAPSRLAVGWAARRAHEQTAPDAKLVCSCRGADLHRLPVLLVALVGKVVLAEVGAECCRGRRRVVGAPVHVRVDDAGVWRERLRGSGLCRAR